jgi:hypothetical protein
MDLQPTLTIVNMKGEPNQEFCLLFRESPNPQVIYDENGWPESPEENMERLKKCGVEVDRKVLFCRRCKGKFHLIPSSSELTNNHRNWTCHEVLQART